MISNTLFPYCVTILDIYWENVVGQNIPELDVHNERCCYKQLDCGQINNKKKKKKKKKIGFQKKQNEVYKK